MGKKSVGPSLFLKDVTTPIAAATKTILVPTAAALPDVNTMLPIRAIALDTGEMYTASIGYWVETTYDEE